MGSRFDSLDKVFWAYLAGFLDGDGCITANIEKNNAYRYGLRIRLRISFTQHRNHRQVLDKLQNRIKSGQVAEYEHNQMSEYVIRDQLVIGQILNSINPYLITKKKHLIYALKFLNLQPVNSSQKNLERALNLAQRIKSLNNYPKRIKLDPVTTEVARPRYQSS